MHQHCTLRIFCATPEDRDGSDGSRLIKMHTVLVQLVVRKFDSPHASLGFSLSLDVGQWSWC